VSRNREKGDFRKGVHELSPSCLAYLQPDGSWGRNNAGLVTDGEGSLLVDTLFTIGLTHEMLSAFRDACPRAARIGQVINTHANGDHCWGNQVVDGAEIISTAKSAAEMTELDPADMAKLAGLARKTAGWGGVRLALSALAGALGVTKVQAVLAAAPYLNEIFGEYDFTGIRLVPPTRTFDGTLTLEVGAKRVELIEVGPAHTKGDLLVWVPEDRVVFTGDILFIDGHPVVWEGPVSNWVAACDRILALNAQAIVPGHGPLTDRAGVVAVRDYLVYLETEARARFEAGMTWQEAAIDISMGQFDHWSDAERVAVNVETLFREFNNLGSRPSVVPCFVAMAKYAAETGCRH